MKKTSFAFFLMFTGFFVYAQNGLVQEMTGTVEIMPPGTETFIAVQVGDEITRDTVISTGFRSFAMIQIGHTSITVRPLTRLTLTEIQASAETETLNVNLQSGRIRVDVNPPAGTRASMSAISPSAVASVRGTSFEFDTRNLIVYEGNVTFAGNRGQVITVRAGGESRIEANSKAANPVEIRIAGLTPTAPAGTDSGGGTNTGPVHIGVEYTLGLVFH